MFKWTCFAGAATVSVALLWMINDLRLHVRTTVDAVNNNLPEILEKTRSTAETMNVLSQDVKQLRELVVGDGAGREANIVAYETDVLRLIENSDGKIGVKKLIGSGLSDPVPAKEWVTRERKLALWDLARSKSKADLLNRIGRSTVLNRAWYIVVSDKAPTPLIEWIKANHPASEDVEATEDTKK